MEINDWIDEFKKKIDENNMQEVEGKSKEVGFFSACIDQNLFDIEQSTYDIFECMDNISKLSTKCQLLADSTRISAQSIYHISPQKETTIRKTSRFIISFVHSISNWLFGFFETSY